MEHTIGYIECLVAPTYYVQLKLIKILLFISLIDIYFKTSLYRIIK